MKFYINRILLSQEKNFHKYNTLLTAAMEQLSACVRADLDENDNMLYASASNEISAYAWRRSHYQYHRCAGRYLASLLSSFSYDVVHACMYIKCEIYFDCLVINIPSSRLFVLILYVIIHYIIYLYCKAPRILCKKIISYLELRSGSIPFSQATN